MKKVKVYEDVSLYSSSYNLYVHFCGTYVAVYSSSSFVSHEKKMKRIKRMNKRSRKSHVSSYD